MEITSPKSLLCPSTSTSRLGGPVPLLALSFCMLFFLHTLSTFNCAFYILTHPLPVSCLGQAAGLSAPTLDIESEWRAHICGQVNKSLRCFAWKLSPKYEAIHILIKEARRCFLHNSQSNLQSCPTSAFYLWWQPTFECQRCVPEFLVLYLHSRRNLGAWYY